jgi:hypothetical protein
METHALTVGRVARGNHRSNATESSSKSSGFVPLLVSRGRELYLHDGELWLMTWVPRFVLRRWRVAKQKQGV